MATKSRIANLGHYAHPSGGYGVKTGPRGVAKVVPAPSLKIPGGPMANGGTGISAPMVGAANPVRPIPYTPPTPKLGMFSPKPPVTSRITAGAPTRKKGK